jgi:hypothetical protein
MFASLMRRHQLSLCPLVYWCARKRQHCRAKHTECLRHRFFRRASLRIIPSALSHTLSCPPSKLHAEIDHKDHGDDLDELHTLTTATATNNNTNITTVHTKACECTGTFALHACERRHLNRQVSQMRLIPSNPKFDNRILYLTTYLRAICGPKHLHDLVHRLPRLCHGCCAPNSLSVFRTALIGAFIEFGLSVESGFRVELWASLSACRAGECVDLCARPQRARCCSVHRLVGNTHKYRGGRPGMFSATVSITSSNISSPLNSELDTQVQSQM